MKKSLLALAVAAVAFSGAASAADLYKSDTTTVKLSGEFDAYATYADSDVDSSDDTADLNASIWGKIQLDTDYKINANNSAFFSFEIESDAEKAVFDDAYAGWTNKTAGTFTIGEAGDSFDAIEKTDITNEGLYAGTIESADTSNAFRWQKAFGGLALSADIQTNTDSADNVYAASADWAITDAVSVAGGYSTSGSDEYTAAGSISGQFNNLYLAASYSHYENYADEFMFTGETEDVLMAELSEGDTFGFAAAYQMNDTRFYGTYALVDDDNDAQFNVYTVGVDYSVIDNILVFAEYSGVSGDNHEDNSVDGNLFLVGTYLTF